MCISKPVTGKLVIETLSRAIPLDHLVLTAQVVGMALRACVFLSVAMITGSIIYPSLDVIVTSQAFVIGKFFANLVTLKTIGKTL